MSQVSFNLRFCCIKIEIAVEFNEIGETNILKVLKLAIEYTELGFDLINEKYHIIICYKHTSNLIIIMEGSHEYNYEIPEKNTPIKESFLKFFEQQCKIKKIKVKK